MEGFWLGRHEVTNVQYRRFRSDHHSGTYRGHALAGDDHPVVGVNWYEASEFAALLSRETGERFRLPTEAEWEYAARAGSVTARYWGDAPDEACAHANVYDRTAESVLGVDQGEPASIVGDFGNALSISYPLLVDQDNSVNRTYGVSALPTTVFIDSEGIVSEVFTGIVNQAVLEDRIERLIADG